MLHRMQAHPHLSSRGDECCGTGSSASSTETATPSLGILMPQPTQENRSPSLARPPRRESRCRPGEVVLEFPIGYSVFSNTLVVTTEQTAAEKAVVVVTVTVAVVTVVVVTAVAITVVVVTVVVVTVVITAVRSIVVAVTTAIVSVAGVVVVVVSRAGLGDVHRHRRRDEGVQVTTLGRDGNRVSGVDLGVVTVGTAASNCGSGGECGCRPQGAQGTDAQDRCGSLHDAASSQVHYRVLPSGAQGSQADETSDEGFNETLRYRMLT